MALEIYACPTSFADGSTGETWMVLARDTEATEAANYELNRVTGEAMVAFSLPDRGYVEVPVLYSELVVRGLETPDAIEDYARGLFAEAKSMKRKLVKAR